MPILISFLRGINVGGRNKIKMADLRALYASLGFHDTRTLLQSGNAIFATDETDLARAQQRIEAGIQERFGFAVDVVLRRADDFRSTLARHAFTQAQLEEPGKVVFVFLSAEPIAAAVEKLRESNPGREIIHSAGRELFIFFTDGQARSKLNNSRIERALGLHSTARNWNTCQKILKLLEATEAQASRST